MGRTGTGIPVGTGRVAILSTGRVQVWVTVLCYGYGSGSKNAVPADLYKACGCQKLGLHCTAICSQREGRTCKNIAALSDEYKI